MTLNEFITNLTNIAEEHGEKQVVLSSDPEGNSYFDIQEPFASWSQLEFCYAHSEEDEDLFDAVVIYPAARLDEYYTDEADV